jgi:outer membrane lipoprotein LolB
MTRTRLALYCLKLRAGAMLLPFLLVGCASIVPPAAPDPAAAEQAASRPYRDTMSIGGRLSVRYQQNGNDEAIHGSFNWQQDVDRTLVTLISPLGQTIAIIEITPTVSTLTQAGQAPRTANNVDDLVAGALGWPLPVSGLRNWLQGFAVDADGRRFVASPLPNASTVTTQDGWRIHYAAWQDDAGQNRPRRIDLERSTSQAGDVAIRIVLDSWQPG